MTKYFMKKGNDLAIDIESYFKGLRVMSVSGIGEIGKASNIYIERSVISNEADVFIHTDSENKPFVTYEPKEVLMTFLVDDTRHDVDVRKVKDCFINYLQGIVTYWDDSRLLKNDLIFMGDVETPIQKYNSSFNLIQFSCRFEKVKSIDVPYEL